MNKLALYGGERHISYELPSVRDVSGRDIGQEELALVAEVIESGNLGYIYGVKIKQFQREWAGMYRINTAVAVSNGTAALHAAIIFLKIGPGDEVLVPAITDMGTVIAVLAEHAVPVFVDVDGYTQNMDPADLERKITDRTKAIIPVHLYGFPCDMDPIMDIARKHGLFVVEDCCQAHLTEYKGQLVGTIGDLGCFSFQQSKHMTTGDGGMVITNRDELCGRKLLHCADKGWPREQFREHLFLAPNYHMTELQAAVGLAQLRKLPAFVERRRTTAVRLSRIIADIPGVYPPPEETWAKHTYYQYPLVIDPDRFTVDNTVLAGALTAEGLKTDPSYLHKPIYMYDLVTDRTGYIEESFCPVAARACKSMLYFPWNEKITDKHVDDMARAIRKVLVHFGKG